VNAAQVWEAGVEVNYHNQHDNEHELEAPKDVFELPENLRDAQYQRVSIRYQALSWLIECGE